MGSTKQTHRLEELIQKQQPVVKRIAERCEVDYSTVYRWRNGITSIPSDQLPVLADFFGVSIVYFMGWDCLEKDVAA